jgi:hypothetical protein
MCSWSVAEASTIRDTYINTADTRGGEKMSTIRNTYINTNTADTRGGEQMSIIRNIYINVPPRIQLTLVVPLQTTKAKINCSICPFHLSMSNVFADYKG